MKKKPNADELETEFETELNKKEDELKTALNKIRELTQQNSTLTFELEKAKTENIKKDETIVEERKKISGLQENLFIKIDKVKILEGKLHRKKNQNDIDRRRGNSRGPGGNRGRLRGPLRGPPYQRPYSTNSEYAAEGYSRYNHPTEPWSPEMTSGWGSPQIPET